ncbi:Type III secretion system SsaH protein [Mycoavidus cysteinexigens]|uniref:Type III secretion system SsaH protein n=1 Tax=Mycoavidus cysteinexigens TaxID=1553431 RepID=A0A2Z6ESG8_9BURK|nr:DUF1039 domain-containing protein [Mycoavidus cysteinexigens]BBE08344.1 Type III secretion system SsaH protein [Mycoavidus cysteinexigens]GAM52953.1 hypothetical protein EBME_1416 [bacterium endosymbiont of Mortierella elongata FMR23-6]GLR00850.1 hypothetical protein GCM10007934_06620 [Mycoavidus cysteinexigens]
MTELARDIKRLLVEAAIAAPNHGLVAQAQGLLEVLPALGLEGETQALAAAMVHFGLRQPRTALETIKNLDDSCAQDLRQMIANYTDDLARKNTR